MDYASEFHQKNEDALFDNRCKEYDGLLIKDAQVLFLKL